MDRRSWLARLGLISLAPIALAASGTGLIETAALDTPGSRLERDEQGIAWRGSSDSSSPYYDEAGVAGLILAMDGVDLLGGAPIVEYDRREGWVRELDRDRTAELGCEVTRIRRGRVTARWGRVGEIESQWQGAALQRVTSRELSLMEKLVHGTT